MAYNKDREGYETKDGGLIRINGNDRVRIDIYDGNERVKGEHTRDTIKYDTNTGKGTIDSHNADKTEKSSTDVNCYLTTACIRHMNRNFDDNCEELMILRWFRDKFVSKNDIDHYYKVAPIVVDAINDIDSNNKIYDYIYNQVIKFCVEEIKKGNYDIAYSRYKNSVLILEEQFAKPKLEKKLAKILREKLKSVKN